MNSKLPKEGENNTAVVTEADTSGTSICPSGYQPVNTLHYYTSPVHLEATNYSASSFVPRGRELWQPHPVFTPQYTTEVPLPYLLS